MNSLLEADRETGRVKVEAGVALHDLNAALWGLGLAMENLGDIDVQSLAGAISTATHGTGGACGTSPPRSRRSSLSPPTARSTS